MRANNGDGGNIKGAKQKPREIQIEKEYENSALHKIPIPVRVSALSDDKSYTESKYTLHSSSKTNKLATLNGLRNIT